MVEGGVAGAHPGRHGVARQGGQRCGPRNERCEKAGAEQERCRGPWLSHAAIVTLSRGSPSARSARIAWTSASPEAIAPAPSMYQGIGRTTMFAPLREA